MAKACSNDGWRGLLQGSALQACTAAKQVLLEEGRGVLVRMRMRVYAADAWPRLDSGLISGLISPRG